MLRITKVKEINFLPDQTTIRVSTGHRGLDKLLDGGISTGGLHVFQAPTGYGKSTFMMMMALRCLRQGHKVLYLGLGEQKVDELFHRIVCMDAQIEYKGIGSGNYTESEIRILDQYRTSEMYDNLGLYSDMHLFDEVEMQYEDEHCSVKYEKVNNFLDDREIFNQGYKFIFIDYLGSVLTKDSDANQSYFITELAFRLQELCASKNIAIITAMQMKTCFYADIKKQDFRPDLVGPDYTAVSTYVYQPSSVAWSMFDVNGVHYINVFKNRFNGKRNCFAYTTKKLTFEIEDPTSPINSLNFGEDAR